MNNPIKSLMPHIQAWYYILAILIIFGILLRVINLNEPVYWVDEVATSIRISGYTNEQVTQQLATGEPLQAADLLHFQQLRTDHSWNNFLSVLTQSPEHPPLYFILARFWVEQFGSSVIATRSLSVIFGLLSLPAMYGLVRELFHSSQNKSAHRKKTSIPQTLTKNLWALNPFQLQFANQTSILNEETYAKLIGWTSMGLLAISPFFIAYAQEARPYSLWILLLLLVNGFLWQALQLNQSWLWWSYTICLILSLYTSLLTIMVVLGHTLSIIWLYPQRRKTYLIATGLALLAFLPWILVVLSHWQTLQENTNWTQVAMPVWALFSVWFYSLAVLFFDFPIAVGRPWLIGLQLIVAMATVSLIVYAIYYFSRKSPQAKWGFLLMGACSTPIILLFIDLIRNGQAAATPRYLMPTHLFVLIVVAYLLSNHLLDFWHRWRIIIAILLSVTLFSSVIGIHHSSKYQKSRNLSNPKITNILNQESAPQLIAESDQIQDLISLSYNLNSDVNIYILPSLVSTNQWLKTIKQPTFIFNPSQSIKMSFKETKNINFKKVYEPKQLISGELRLSLWKITNKKLINPK